MTNCQQDLFSPGGRLEGMQGFEMSIGEQDFAVCRSISASTGSLNERWVLTETQQLADKVWWATRPVQNLRPFEVGHAGFQVGSYVPTSGLLFHCSPEINQELIPSQMVHQPHSGAARRDNR